MLSDLDGIIKKDNNKKFHRSETCMQEQRFRHLFWSGLHEFLNDASIPLINVTDPEIHLKHKDFWNLENYGNTST